MRYAPRTAQAQKIILTCGVIDVFIHVVDKAVI